MVMSIERSPRSAMSAQTSSIPSIQGASATTSATSSAVRSAHSAWVSTAKSDAEISSVANLRSSSASGSRCPTRREISIAAVVPGSSVPSMSNTCRAVIAAHDIHAADGGGWGLISARGPVLTAIAAKVAAMTTTLNAHIPRASPAGSTSSSRIRARRRSFTGGCSAGASPRCRRQALRPTPLPAWAAATRPGSGLDGCTGAWNTYIAVDDADAVAARMRPRAAWSATPATSGPAGRMAVCATPPVRRSACGRPAGLRRPGRQRAGRRGTSATCTRVRRTRSPSTRTCSAGWVRGLGFATIIRRPGYGDHLEATVDPTSARARRAIAPPGFEDAIAWLAPLEPGWRPHWHVTFAVADRDAAAARPRASALPSSRPPTRQWTRTALIRDPQGAVFTASQFTPPN